MADTVNQAEVFDRARRRAVRDRAYRRSSGQGFIHEHMVNEMLDRLSLANRNFSDALVIGTSNAQLRQALSNQGIAIIFADSGFRMTADSRVVQCDEDRLPFADQSFDLIMNLGTLDTVNDLPGALALTRRILRPDGLFLASFFGAGSLVTLKSLLMEAETDHVSPHIHPQIDVRTAGDLMTRAGLALPVADGDRLDIRYSSLDRLIEDIRDHGGLNILKHHVKPIRRATYRRAQSIFDQLADDDGKTTETIEIINLSGWAPHPEQPKPARRGSGQVSLKTALSQRST